MPDEITNSAEDARIGAAIAEYLTAIDSRVPFDMEAWLSKHDDIRDSLSEFIDDQSQLHRFATQDSRASALWDAKLTASVSTDGLIPNANTSTHKEAVIRPKVRIEVGGDLGPYHLVSELGHGGMGQVYAARHQSLGRMVALKVMVAGDRADETDRRRFRREAEAVAKLDHPNIVPIFEVGQQHGWDYFTMKLLPGGSLRDWMTETQNVSVRQIAEVMMEIALALQHAHQRGVLHRDLKPGNILLDEQQRPCLVDFGLAKQVSQDRTTLGNVIGTPAYMAPEQLYGETTTLSDVYGLGGTLYSLLTKRPPFAAKSLPDLAEQIRQRSPGPLRKYRPDIPKDLEVICLKCLEKAPEARYGSAAEFAADLRRWLNGEAILARPASWRVHVWKWCRRYPMVSSLAATLLTVVVGATVVLSLLLAEAKRLGLAAETKANEARIAATEATQQRDRARQVLDVMTSTVAYEWLAGQQSLTSSQQIFLQQNVEYYRELAAEVAGATESNELLWLAQVQHRLASLLGRLGDREDALRLSAEASETLDKIPSAWQTNQVLLVRSQVLHDRQTWMADAGQLQPSLSVLDDAIAVLGEVLTNDPTNREAAQRLGQLRVDLGTRYRFLGKTTEALNVLQEAVDWNTHLLTQQPETSGIRRQLAISYRTLGLVQMQLRDYQSASASMSAALAVQSELAKQFPDQWRLQADLAYTLDNLGIVADRQGDLGQAAEYISQAIEQRRPLLVVLPGEETLHRALMQSYRNLASIIKSQSNWDEHREVLQQALEHVQNAQTRFPTIPEYRYWEWVAKLGMAENRSHAQECEQALTLLNEIIPLLEATPPDATSSRILQNQLLRAWNARAPIMSQLGEHEAALADWQSCIDKTKGIEQTNHRLCQAVAYAKAEQAEMALRVVEDVMQDTSAYVGHPLLANMHYNVACVKSLLAAQTENPERREALLSAGTEAITESLKCGWTAIDWLREDPDLAALNEYTPFQTVLNQWLEKLGEN